MAKILNLSDHAIDRIKERTRLCADDVAAIMFNNAYVNLGSKPGILKVHRLFFSTPDENFFVAICDELNGGVITVIPLEYQDNSYWKVTEEQKAEARKFWQIIDSSINHFPGSYSISVSYTDRVSGNQKIKMLMKIPYEYDIDAAYESAKSKLTNLHIANQSFKLGILATDIFAVSIKHGRRLPKFFDFPFPDDDSSLRYFETMIK